MTDDESLTFAPAGTVLFKQPKNPPAPDHVAQDRALYDLAYALLGTVGGTHDWGEPIKLTRKADNGSIVTTTICIPEAQTDG